MTPAAGERGTTGEREATDGRGTAGEPLLVGEVAVIFTSQRAGDDHGYAATAERMEALAAAQPGYRGFESARNPDGSGIAVSYWATEDDAVAWKQVAEHLDAQQAGRDRWYEHYTVRIATVTRTYRWSAPT